MILATSQSTAADLDIWNYICEGKINIFKDKSAYTSVSVQLSLCRTKGTGWLKQSEGWDQSLNGKITSRNFHLKFKERSLTNYWLKHPKIRASGWKSTRAETLSSTDVNNSVLCGSLSTNSRPGGRILLSWGAWLCLENVWIKSLKHITSLK